MFSPLRFPAALVLAALLALPVAAQDDRATPDDDAREIIIEREPAPGEGERDVFRFRLPDDGAVVRSDTVIDGRRIVRFRLPGGDEETFEFEMPEVDPEHFRMHVMPEVERFRFESPDARFGPEFFEREGFFERDGAPFGRRMREMMEGLGRLDSRSAELRREMMELERRTHELAAEMRRAEGAERAEAEQALDAALAELFALRGEMREARAARMVEEAERLREEAEMLRQSLREREQERRALIEKRKRELLGEPGADW
ncbi:MAG: hypothetical protein R3181_14960 [Rubricoccaceae bacterium]|nr:hypothetical protein [Rubricoccaceae bacterium]